MSISSFGYAKFMLLPFHAAVPDKVFPFQLCSILLFQTSAPCSCSRQSISIPTLFHASVPDFRSMQLFLIKVFGFQCYSMHLFQTSVLCSCSRQSISVPALFHASVPDFCSMQCSIPYSIPFCVPFHVPFRGCLRFLIVVFPDHTHLLFFSNRPKLHCL